MCQLPSAGYLELPLSFSGGRFAVCPLVESMRRYIGLCLSNARAGGYAKVIKADPGVGCDVPHSEYDAVVRSLISNRSKLRAAIAATIRACEARVRKVKVYTPGAGRAGWRSSGLRVEIVCTLTDTQVKKFAYDVAVLGKGPIEITGVPR